MTDVGRAEAARTPLVVRDVVKTYEHGAVRALDGVSLTVERGEFVAVTGPSGSGKSTLLHVAGALDVPDSGSVRIDGRDLAAEPRLDRVRATSVGFVFQLHHLIPTLTAAENVAVPLHATGVAATQRAARSGELLDAVGLADRVTHRPAQLSGGQRQRVAVARALVNAPAVVLADEPTGNLDQESGRAVLDLLDRLRRERGVALVVVTHDKSVAGRADREVRIVDGRVAPPAE